MSDERALTLRSTSADETRAIGERLGALLEIGDIVLLHGDLGSGKTTFTQGIARGLGCTDYVQSPTFTLVAEHRGFGHGGAPIVLYHLDLYRLRDESDLESFGFEQFLYPVHGISVIEWPERASRWLPDDYLLIEFEIAGVDERSIALRQFGSSAHLLAIIDGLEIGARKADRIARTARLN